MISFLIFLLISKYDFKLKINTYSIIVILLGITFNISEIIIYCILGSYYSYYIFKQERANQGV